MKKLFFLPVIAGMMVLVAGCSGNGNNNDVVYYNNTFVELADKCFTAEGLMREAMDQENWGLARTLYTTAVDTCKASQSDAAVMNAYEDDTSLRDAVDTLLQAEINYLEKFGETMAYRDYDELTDDQEAAYTALENELSTIEQTINTANDDLNIVQEAFSAKHGYELES